MRSAEACDWALWLLARPFSYPSAIEPRPGITIGLVTSLSTWKTCWATCWVPVKTVSVTWSSGARSCWSSGGSCWTSVLSSSSSEMLANVKLSSCP